MIKAILRPEDWQEVETVLRKYQIGYTVSFDAHLNTYQEQIIAINPIGVHYYNDTKET